MESKRLTVIPADSTVYRDQGVSECDLSQAGIPNNVHALQWNDGIGQIELITTDPNIHITELPEWALKCIDLWEQEHINAQNLT